MRFLVAFIWLALTCGVDAQVSMLSGGKAKGHSVINVGSGTLSFAGSFTTTNLVKQCGSFNAATSWLALVNSDLYPVNTASLSSIIVCSIGSVIRNQVEDFTINWSGTGRVQLTRPGATSVISTVSSNCTVTGTGTVTYTVTGSNCSVRFTIDGTPVASNYDIGVTFTVGSVFTNFSNLVICSTSECGNGQTFSSIFRQRLTELNPGTIRFINWSVMSTSNAVGDFSSTKRYSALQWAQSNFVPTLIVGDNGCGVGNTCGTDTYTVASAPASPAAYSMGENLHLTFVNANTSSVPTINRAGLGAKPLAQDTLCQIRGTNRITAFTSLVGGSGYVNGTYINVPLTGGTGQNAIGATITVSGGAVTNVSLSCAGTINTGDGYTAADVLSASNANLGGSGSGFSITVSTVSSAGPTISANLLQTVVYDAILGKWLLNTQASLNGLRSIFPVAGMVELCNTMRVNCWIQIPTNFTDQAVSDFVTYVRDNLASGLQFWIELSNEVWSFSNSQTLQYYARGLALGFPDAIDDYYALRYRQVMGIATTTWTATRNNSELKRIQTQQVFYSAVTTEQNRFLGVNLKLDASGNYCSGSGCTIVTNYTSAGACDTSTSHGRPVDCMDYNSYAPYWWGAQIQCSTSSSGALPNSSDNCFGFSNTGSGMAPFVAASDDYASGTSSRIASALQFVFDDVSCGIRNGAYNVGLTLCNLNGTMPSGTNVDYYARWNTLAAAYGKSIALYEGGASFGPPGASILSGLSPAITSSPGGCATAACVAAQMQALLIAFRASDYFRNLANKQLQTFYSYSQSLAHAQFDFGPDNQVWSLWPPNCRTPPCQISDFTPNAANSIPTIYDTPSGNFIAIQNDNSGLR